MNKKVNCLNLIRLLAAFQVMSGHVIEHLEIDFYNVRILGCFPGVPIFFALSGFLVWFSVERTENIKIYIKKRFVRIYPELWLGVVIEIVILLLLHRITDIIDFLLFAFGQMTFFQFWTPDSLRAYGCGTPNGSLWTIGILIQFYVLIWWVYQILHKKNYKIWICLWCGIIFISHMIGLLLQHTAPSILFKIYDQTIIPYMWLFMIGCFFAEYYQVVLEFLKKYWFCLLGISVIVYITGFDIRLKYNIIQSVLLFTGILGFAYRFPRLNIKKDISYGIYIYHMTVVNAMLVLGFKGRTVYLIMVFIITCATAFVTSELITKIEHRWRKQLCSTTKPC